MIKIGPRGRGFGFHDIDTDIIYLWIPESNCVGSDVKGVIRAYNGKTKPFRGDLIEIVFNILEHEELHKVIQKLVNPMVSAWFDSTEYAIQEVEKLNKEN